MSTLFISDLHLETTRPDITQYFLTLLENLPSTCDAVYILGDLFEVWLGDDDRSKFNQTITDAIKHVSDQGVPVYFMHGNRDFLIGEQFATDTGCQLLPEEHIIDLYGKKTLLLHGDTLCTQDEKYQAFRKKVRSETFRTSILKKPLFIRKLIASSFRLLSKLHTRKKENDTIMDVEPQEVINVFKKHNLEQMIHGHTHRPAIHPIDLEGKTVERMVLSDWHSQGNVLLYQPDGSKKLIYFKESLSFP